VIGIIINGILAHPLDKEYELIRRVRAGDCTGAKEKLNEWLTYVLFANVDNVDTIKMRILELLIILSRAAVEGGAPIKKILEYNSGCVNDLFEINDIEALCLWIKKVLDRLLEEINNAEIDEGLAVLENAMEHITQYYNEKLTLESVAKAASISPSHLSHLFKDKAGCTFVEFLTKVRIDSAKHLLRVTKLSVLEIALAVGYDSSSHFSSLFSRYEGISPVRYRQGFMEKYKRFL